MIGFGIRNLKVFFKDRTAVFFSLLAVFIVIGLYALFLGDVWVENYQEIPGVRQLMDAWIVAGLLTVTSVTTVMGAFGTMMDDKVWKINRDFAASPIRHSSILGGYVLSAAAIGMIMSLVALALCQVYMVTGGGSLLSPLALLKVLGLLVLTTVTNTALLLFLISFFRSSNAFGTASTVIGTLIGFLTGIYLPVGSLPQGVQWVIKCFPVSHAAALLRQIMMEVPMQSAFAGAPAQAAVEFEQQMGVTYRFGGTEVAPLVSVGILLGSAALFFGLGLWRLSRKEK